MDQPSLKFKGHTQLLKAPTHCGVWGRDQPSLRVQKYKLLDSARILLISLVRYIKLKE
jgi:hypothetical protein